MRALLVVNPMATTTTERGRDVLVRALRSEVDLAVEYTRRRGHAAELASRAASDGYDVVVTLGGDGTVNEVVNGLLRDGPGPSVPALAVVPGGSTNVFARALGLPKEWTEGTGVILEALHTGRVRTVGLGRADERYFTFCAGFGLDAEVVRKVERARLRGKVSTPALYVRSTVAQFFLETNRKNSHDHTGAAGRGERGRAGHGDRAEHRALDIPGRPADQPVPGRVIRPGPRPHGNAPASRPGDGASGGPDLSRRPNPHGKHVVSLHDVAEFTLRAERPLAFQVDGDFSGSGPR